MLVSFIILSKNPHVLLAISRIFFSSFLSNLFILPNKWSFPNKYVKNGAKANAIAINNLKSIKTILLVFSANGASAIASATTILENIFL